MEMIGCQCEGLPAHDHLLGQGPDERGVYGPIWGKDATEIGRVWVDWKDVARALSGVPIEADDDPVAPVCP